MDINIMRWMQLEKTIGELNALKISYYDSTGLDRELYLKAEKIIDGMVDELRDNLG